MWVRCQQEGIRNGPCNISGVYLFWNVGNSSVHLIGWNDEAFEQDLLNREMPKQNVICYQYAAYLMQSRPIHTMDMQRASPASETAANVNTTTHCRYYGACVRGIWWCFVKNIHLFINTIHITSKLIWRMTSVNSRIKLIVTDYTVVQNTILAMKFYRHRRLLDLSRCVATKQAANDLHKAVGPKHQRGR